MRPLSHHDILRLIAPFTARGYRLDQDATDRSARRIGFRSGADDSGSERLVLVVPEAGVSQLVRRAGSADGEVTGELCVVDASDIDAALTAVLDAHAPALSVRSRDGVAIALQYRCRNADFPWELVRATARVAGRLVWIDATRGDPEKGRIEYAIGPRDGGELPLPSDLVAVLGRGWGPMQWRESAWRGRLQVTRSDALRRARVERAAERLVNHVGQVFAATPDAFHARYRRARWGVVWRRLLPTVVFALLVLGLVAPMVLVAEFEAPGWFIALSHPFMLFGVMLAIYLDVRLFDVPPLPRRLILEHW